MFHGISPHYTLGKKTGVLFGPTLQMKKMRPSLALNLLKVRKLESSRTLVAIKEYFHTTFPSTL